MTFDFPAYVAAIRRRTEAARAVKVKQVAEAEAAQQAALDDANAAMAGIGAMTQWPPEVPVVAAMASED